MTSLDILVPTFNEEKFLPSCLDSLQAAIGEVRESRFEPPIQICLHVIDGNSGDNTQEIAKSRGVRVSLAEHRGRGRQLVAGILDSTAEWILMIHADSTIDRNGLVELVERIRQHDDIGWGILGHSYMQASTKMRWVQLSNFLRFSIGGIAFGDQGIFVKRQTLEAAGGMPDFPLMEDIELSLRLRKIAKRTRLSGPLHVSTRRWQIKGSVRYTVQVLSLVTRYLTLRALGADLERTSHRMYQEYYGS